MGTESGPPDAGIEPGAITHDLRDVEPGAITHDLRDAPQAFGFFQALRLLQRSSPARAKVGEFGHPADEVARISVNPSLAFAAGEVQELRDDEEGPARMQVNFMGLVGNQGVLPTHYSLLVQSESRRDERPLTTFLDMFQHRLLSLFYRAWERARFYVPFERREPDRVSRHLFDLIGLGHERLRRRMALRDDALLFYCGLLGARQRSAQALEQLLADYFEAPVRVDQFLGGWYGLSAASRCLIDDEPPDHAPSLGEGAALGDEIWDPQARVRIRVGPLSRERYDMFLPGGSAFRALQSIVEFFSDGQLDFELQPVLESEEVPGITLGEEADRESPPLGWCTWIRTRPFDRDADDAMLSLTAGVQP